MFFRRWTWHDAFFRRRLSPCESDPGAIPSFNEFFRNLQSRAMTLRAFQLSFSAACPDPAMGTLDWSASGGIVAPVAGPCHTPPPYVVT